MPRTSFCRIIDVEKSMTFRGTVKGGVIVLKDPLGLPDGTEVDVRPLKPANDSVGSPAWGEVLKEFIGKAEGLPQDMARNHDHYLHGAPKR